MNKISNSLLAGFAGAAALNILHQSVAQFMTDAPRVDRVGEEALSKTIEATGASAPTGNSLFTATMAADLVSNSVYYSLAGYGSKRHVITRAAGLGLLAGIGAVTLTGEMGLNDKPVTRTRKTRLMTVAYYVVGGLVSGLTLKMLTRRG